MASPLITTRQRQTARKRAIQAQQVAQFMGTQDDDPDVKQLAISVNSWATALLRSVSRADRAAENERIAAANRYRPNRMAG